MQNPRYEGRPLLRLVELYALWCIGKLDGQQDANLRNMAPKLAATFNATGEWHAIIETVLQLPPNAPAQLQTLWREALAATAGSADPQSFAEQFADQLAGEGEP